MIRGILFTVFAPLLLMSCTAVIANKNVTMVDDKGIQYLGAIDYKDGYSGVLTISEGPGGESFSGKFVVVDHTSVSTKQGSIIVPQNDKLPAVGGAAQSSSGEIKADGYWHGVGNKGTTIEGTMTIGRGGHGYGICKDSNGYSYKIMF